jgi:TRAP-type C4-dicarboxylate transport system permease small subunit
LNNICPKYATGGIAMILKWIERFQLTMGLICLSIFIGAILIQVFSRYLSISVIWSEEVANFSFIWSVFMGASVMYRHNEHFRFTSFLNSLPGKKKTYLNMIINLILLMFNLAMLYYGFLTVQYFWNYTWVTIPALKMGYVWLCVPVAMIGMTLYTIERLIADIKSLKEVQRRGAE